MPSKADVSTTAGAGLGPGLGSRLRGRRVLLTVGTVPLLVLAVLAVGLSVSQSDSRAGIRERFAARGVVTADVLKSYITDLMAHERRVAASTLADKSVQEPFAKEVAAFGFQAAVPLDSQGRALAVSPTAPDVIGQNLSNRYPHLAAAVAGTPAVSPVVASAARDEAVVAFAVPFDTRFGRRVFSGAYQVTQTPLASFLRDALTTPLARLFVVDSTGRVVAGNHDSASRGQFLSNQDPALGRVSHGANEGYVNEHGGRFYYTKLAVPGTPWTLAMSIPTSYLYIAVDGASHWVPWLILAGLGVILAFAAWLATRVVAQRRRLVEANERLERLARTDALTGLFNRRSVNEQLRLMCASARRHEFPIAVLMVDVDMFKQLNDTFGHSAGDDALRHVADRLASGLRTEDMAGRWGGEEFVILLPHTSLDEAMVVAERLRSEVANAPIALGEGGDLVTLSVSIGVAAHAGELPDTLLHRADVALYEAKRSGRNRVHAAQPTNAH